MGKKQTDIRKMRLNMMGKYFSPLQNNTFSADNPTSRLNADSYTEPGFNAERTDDNRSAFMQQKMEQGEAIRQQENFQEAFKEGVFSALADNLYKTHKQKGKIKGLSKGNKSNEKNINDLISLLKKEKIKRRNLEQDLKQLKTDTKHLYSDIKKIKKTLTLVNRYLNVSTKKAEFHDLASDLKNALGHSQK